MSRIRSALLLGIVWLQLRPTIRRHRRNQETADEQHRRALAALFPTEVPRQRSCCAVCDVW